jgi:hypothetical protein
MRHQVPFFFSLQNQFYSHISDVNGVKKTLSVSPVDAISNDPSMHPAMACTWDLANAQILVSIQKVSRLGRQKATFKDCICHILGQENHSTVSRLCTSGSRPKENSYYRCPWPPPDVVDISCDSGRLFSFTSLSMIGTPFSPAKGESRGSAPLIVALLDRSSSWVRYVDS